MDSQTAFLDRRGAAEYLTARGLRVSRNTLQKLVTVGGGPRYQVFGSRAVYRRDELDAWAQSKLSELRATAKA